MSRAGRIFTLIFIVACLVCQVPICRADQNQLAILTFRPTNLEAMGYEGEILYALISVLQKDDTIALMPRREMEEILFQKGMVQGDTPEMALAAGKVLGANFVLFGRVTKKGGQIISEAHLLDTQSRQIIKSWSNNFSGREDILARVPSFADELRDAIRSRSSLVAAIHASEAQMRPQVSIENLRTKSEGKQVALTWKFDPSQPIIGFHVYRAENPDGPYQFLGNTDKNIFKDLKIKKGHTYYYRVGILHSSGEEIQSEQTAQIKNAGERVPHPPLVLGGKSYVRRAEINFVPSLLNEKEKFKIKDYKVHRKKKDADSWETITTIDAKVKSPSGFGFVVEDNVGLEDGQEYVYAVSSVDKKNKESVFSDLISIETFARPKLSLVKDNLLRRIDFSWEPFENVEGYYIYRRVTNEDWVRVGKVRGASKSTFKDDKDLEDEQAYQYYLTTYDKYGETGPSNIVKAKTKDLTPPPQDLLPKSEMVKSVQLTWTPLQDPDVGGYAIYRGTSKKELKLIAKVKGNKSYTYLDKGTGFSPLEDGIYYYYALTSYNLYGAEGKPSSIEIARTKPRPSPARSLMVKAESDHILVQWDKNPETDVKAYVLYRSKNRGGYSKVKGLDTGQIAYRDEDLRPDTTYRYKLIVEDKDGLKSDPAESEEVPSPIVKPKG
ncbi:hypothetical protein ACFL9U_12430 [Thermodesulfobacteriota bacterium]